MSEIQTLGQFIAANESDFPGGRLEFASVLSSIRLAAKIVNKEINKAGITKDIIGSTSLQNIQGEVQQKLDVFADNSFIAAMKYNGDLAGVASEENEKIVQFETEAAQEAKYILVMDPLDGSSNIDVNVSVGTIFAIYQRVTPLGSPLSDEDFMQGGNAQLAAGYVIYGSSTMLVYTAGNGLHGFTFDPAIGVFFLSHPNMQSPQDGNMYSVNEGNYLYFPEGVKRYLKYCQEYDKESNRPYTSRYIGSLVADFHRNLIKGGVYIYPTTKTSPEGKLRLLYECYPLAFMIEQANGKASDGRMRIMDIEINDIHQRSPMIIGSTEMVNKVEEFMRIYW